MQLDSSVFSTSIVREFPDESPAAGGQILLMRRREIFIAIVVAVATGLAWAAPVQARVVVRDPNIFSLSALDGTLLYSRWSGVVGEQGQWMRLVDGRRRRANGFPRDGRVVSIGRDAAGRIVAVTPDQILKGGRLRLRGWLTYDIVSDRVKPLRVRARKGCTVEAAAVWHTIVAYVEHCHETYAVVVRESGRVRRFRNVGGWQPELVLRGRSLLVAGGEEQPTLWRVLDRGRACPRVVTSTDEEYGIWGGFGPGGIAWAHGSWTFDGQSHFADVRVWGVALAGRCERWSKARSRGQLPERTLVRDVAIDGRWLYYATDRAVHRQPL